MEVTKREVLVGVIIAIVMVGLGFFISSKIHDMVTVSNEGYFKALKIDNDEELFEYAINTSVGQILSSGSVAAQEAVSISDIEGEYFSIRKIEEHYVEKTRTVTRTDDDGNTYTETETYWEWEEVDREEFHTGAFTYLGQVYDFDFIHFNHYSYKETIGGGLLSFVRYQYYTIPKEFPITLYSKTTDGSIEGNIVHLNQTLEGVIKQKEKEADVHVIIYWVFWVILTIGAVLGFIALDNRYLNAK